MNIKYYQMLAVSIGLTWMIYPPFIRFLKRINVKQSVSDYALESFKTKQKTPILGGVVFILVPIISFFLFNIESIHDHRILLLVFTFLSYGLIGFIDDVKIIIEKKNDGLPAWTKFGLQILIAVIFFYVFRQNLSTLVRIPFTQITFSLNQFYGVLVLIMLSGASNGVNLTDGMDGLAGGTSLIAFGGFAILAFVQQEYLIFAFLLSLMASLAVYLYFNHHPAQIFMGDTGALALGALLAATALILKQEFTLLFIGFVFVYETLCVMLQIFWVKTFKKRLFKYTPIHYSFTLNGYKERHVVYFFWLLGLISMIIGVYSAL